MVQLNVDGSRCARASTKYRNVRITWTSVPRGANANPIVKLLLIGGLETLPGMLVYVPAGGANNSMSVAVAMRALDGCGKLVTVTS